MNTFEKSAREVVEKHGCTFIKMIGECRALWKNKYDYESIDDVFVLKCMSESAWNFWRNYNPMLSTGNVFKFINERWENINMAKFNDWRIYNTTEEEREKLFNSDFDFYYDGKSPTVLIDGSKEEFEAALKLIGRK